MVRLIEFHGRTIQVPDNATDDQVRQILSAPAPAPRFNGIPVAEPHDPPASSRQVTGGNRFGGIPVQSALPNDSDGQSQVMTNALAAGSQASQFFNREPVAPEPTLVDHIMGGARYAGDTLAIGADRFGKGLVNVAGLPVDAANLAVEGVFRGTDAVLPGDQSWLKTSSNPLGGSQSLNHIRTGAGLVDYEEPEAEDWFQAIFGRVGEELGAAALPIGGLTAAGGRIGAKAARDSSNWFVQNLIAPAAASPGRFVGSEIAGSTAAGMGAGIANLLADRNTTGGQIADMVGALGGAGLYGIGSTLGRGLGQALNAFRQNPNYIDQTVKDAVVDRLGVAAGLDGLDTPMDTDELVELITRGDTARPSEIIPGFQESLADVTANPGLAALEYGRQSGPNAGMFTTRRTANNQAVDQTMGALAPNQTPGAFRSELEAQRDLRLVAAADQTNAAQSEFDAYIQNLQPRMGAEERGATIRSGLDNAHRYAREMEDMAWTGLEGQVDPAPLADTLDSTIDNLSVARQQRVSDLDQTVDIPRRLAGGNAPSSPLDPRSEAESQWQRLTGGTHDLSAVEPTTTNIQELLDMRSVLLEERRNAMSGQQPDRTRASSIGQMVDDINAYLDSDAVPANVRAQLDDARAVSREVNETFNRPNDPIAQTLARSEGRPDLPDSAVGPRFVQPDNRQASNIDRLLAQTDLSSHGGSVREAVRDEILAALSKSGPLTAAGIETKLNQFTRAFDRFPDLRDEITSAAQAGRTFDAASEAQTALTRDLGSSDGTVPGRGPVGRYLQYSDAQSERAISEVLSAKDPGAAADELLGFIGDNPAAVEGARAALWQKLQTESQSAERSMGGARKWRGDWLKSFLDKPATAAVVDRLYRDNPEHLANIRQIADVLDYTDLRVRAKAPATSGTAQGVNPVLTPETLQSRLYAYMRGQVSGTYLATSIAAVMARRAVRNAQTGAIERMTDKALLNPEFAAELLKDNNPANRAAMARKVRTWLGNEASTFINLLNGQDEDDVPNIDDRREPLRVVVSAGDGYSGLAEDEFINAVMR